MENQHRHIKGFRDLSEQEIALMNEVKEHAEKTRELMDRLAAMPALEGEMQNERKRWWTIARTDLQKGFMALVRSVALPTTF